MKCIGLLIFMKMKKLLFLIFLLPSILLFAQNNPDVKRDYQWFFGYRYDEIHGNLMDFIKNLRPLHQLIKNLVLPIGHWQIFALKMVSYYYIL